MEESKWAKALKAAEKKPKQEQRKSYNDLKGRKTKQK
jgi:hypothetical protein